MFFPDTFKLSQPTDCELLITRDFDAPRQMVFDAFTRPEFVSRWMLGPGGWTMPVCEIDLQVGGSYRYVWQNDKNGKLMEIGGAYREIVAPERLVVTEKYDPPWYQGEALNTTVLVEDGNVTKLTIRVRYETMEARDTAFKSGAEQGMAAGFNRLEDLLITMMAEPTS